MEPPGSSYPNRTPQLRSALVIIPTYNEKDNLARIVPAVLAQDPRFDVLIVDDGSPDGTGAIADELAGKSDRVSVLHREKKRGLGTAYIEGFRWGLARDYDILFEMDADFSHDPGNLPAFVSKIEEGYDLVLGSRYLHGRVTVVNWPISRLILSVAANRYARQVTGLPVADATGGFKCFRREVLEALALEEVEANGYAFQIELSFRAWKKGFRIAEIPITFIDRDVGESKMSKSIVAEAVWRVWRLRLLSLRGRL